MVHIDQGGLGALKHRVYLIAEPVGGQGLVGDVEASVSQERVNPYDLGLVAFDEGLKEGREGAADVLGVSDDG